MKNETLILSYVLKRLGDIAAGESVTTVIAEMDMARKTLESIPNYIDNYVTQGIVTAMFGTTEVKEDA